MQEYVPIAKSCSSLRLRRLTEFRAFNIGIEQNKIKETVVLRLFKGVYLSSGSSVLNISSRIPIKETTSTKRSIHLILSLSINQARIAANIGLIF